MNILFFAYLFNSLLMIGLPIVLAIILTRQWKLGWRLWFVGGATFIISQIGHIPFNALASSLLNQTALKNLSPDQSHIFNAIFLGLSAGLFEELARYAVLRWWLKDARSWRKGVLFGAGHGGAEAILLGGLAMYAFFQLVVLRSVDLSTVVPTAQLAQAQQQVAAYWSADWYAALLGALERLFTLVIQISLAVLVMQAFIRKQSVWVWLAVIYHAVVDATAVLVAPSIGGYWTEVVVGGFAIFSLAIIFILRQPEPAEATVIDKDIPEMMEIPNTVEETPENLDNSRFM